MDRRPMPAQSLYTEAASRWIRICLLLAVVVVLFAYPSERTVGTARAQSAAAPFLDRVVASLTVDERVGQLVMVNFVGDDVSAESDVATLVRDFKVGAVLVTSSNGNIVNRDDTAAQLATLTNGLQQRALEGSARREGGDPYFLPLLIATDNEGDLFPFTNITHNYTALPNNMTVGATWSKDQAETTGSIVGKELAVAGINMLLGPVVDVLENPRSGGNGDIGIRSFGGNATWVGELGRAYVRGVHTGSGGRMITVAKHFPGHGGSDRSTDNEVPTVNKSLDQLRRSELAPFAEVGRADAADPAGTTDAMMVSHIRYRNVLAGGAEPFTGPISLDAAAFRGFLDLPEFAAWRSGHMVMSDSLGVPAVKKWYAQQTGSPDFPNRTVVKDALLAGNDLLPLVEFYRDPDHRGWKDNQLPTIEDSILFMREQYAADPAFRRRADDAVRHVMAEKLRLYPKLQMAQVSVEPATASAAAGKGEEQVRALSEAALTLVQPPSVGELRSRLPRGPQSPEKVLIVECWNDCYPFRIMPKQQLQNRLLALYGPAGKARLKPEDAGTISFGELNAWLSKPSDLANASVAKAVGEASWVIFGLTEFNPDGHPDSAAVKRFLDAPPVDLRNKNLIGIAYNVPYHLDSTEISKLAAYFAVYSKTDAAIDTSFRALYGDVTPKGHAPVSVSGTFYSVADAVQPDPSQTLTVSVFGQQPDAVLDTRTIGLVAGPVLDRNGNPVPDGTTLTFSLAKDDGGSTTGTGLTVDGLAGAQLPSSGRGRYTALAGVGSLTSPPLLMTVGGETARVETPAQSSGSAEAAPSGRNSGFPLVLALAVGVLGTVALAAAGVGWALLSRRRRAKAAVAEREPVPAGRGLAAEALGPPRRLPSATLGTVLFTDTVGRTQMVQPRSPLSFSSGRYIVRRVLGEGGQKVVYLVHDEALDRDCALSMVKSELLEADDLERLRREAQAMARLGAHSNIVTVHDTGDEDGKPYLVCEYVPAGELRRHLRDAPARLPLERALAIAADIARALAIAHGRGVIHRDVKPANVWLCDDGSAKLGDFGLAFSIDRTRMTLPGSAMGTATYMAPEQARGEHADARTDLYALGVVLYEMVCGEPPFSGDDPLSVISQHASVAPAAPVLHAAGLPPALNDLILRLLAKSPGLRPESAAIVLEELRAIADHLSTPDATVEPPALRVDLGTRRVYVRGIEAKPGLSNEQFRLLSYLYERAGKVIGREELVLHVWPDAHVEGVSEEALDALVRRVRDRLVQAGGERGYIVTLRGQGFRLDAETA